MAACNLGTSSVAALRRALTNRTEEMRNEAVALLTDGPPKPFPEARRRAVPALISLLDDPSEHIRMNTTNALKLIGPEAAAKAGVK